MESTGNNLIRNYFQHEMEYLRNRSVEFAQDYPDIAAELEFSQGKSADPHIEALLQSFAFLTGRLQYNLQAESPEISNTLLTSLYPHLEAPVPSMAIAHFDVDPEGTNFSNGFSLERHRLLSSEGQTASGEPINCYFQNCYQTNLWPLTIRQIELRSSNHYEFLSRHNDIRAVLKVRIENLASDPISSFRIPSLRFYINGDSTLKYRLYELLLHQVDRVVLRSDIKTQPQWYPNSAIVPQGFDPDQAVLPNNPVSHQGYRYLQEYFMFPDKYLFFDLELGESPLAANQSVDLLFLFKQEIENPGLHKESLRLNCFPIINLFSKSTVPIRLDHRHYEYRLLPDDRQYRYCEVHTVLEVLSKKQGERATLLAPIFSFEESAIEAAPEAYWTFRREVSQLKSLPGTELWLSFHDPDLDLAAPPGEMVYAKALCTNRDLAERMPAGAQCHIEGGGPGSSATLLTKPTFHHSPPLHGFKPWFLVSHLSLNHLSLDGDSLSVEALKEILKLYANTTSPQIAKQIDSLHQLSAKNMVSRIGPDAWRGFCQGKEVILTLDEQTFKGGSPLLFGEVLSHFFAMYTNLHSFTQLVLHSQQRQGEWHRWSPRIGEQIVI